MKMFKIFEKKYDNEIADLLNGIGIFIIYLGIIALIIGLFISALLWDIFHMSSLFISFVISIFCFIIAIKCLLEAEKIEMQYNMRNHIMDILDSVQNIEDICQDNNGILSRVEKSNKNKE